MTLQSGILSLGASEHAYIEFDLQDNADKAELLKALQAILNHPTTHGSNVVLGVRPTLWESLASADHVPAVKDFKQPIVGKDGFEMPATQHDLWFWIAGSDRSAVFDMTMDAIKILASLAKVASETWGWVYHDSRDLTGFEDGTENPDALEAPSVISVPEGVPGAGSTILLYQLWEHKSSWVQTPVKEQEDVIGRTKPDSIELDDDVKPETSHVARTIVDVDGEELDILRRNTAFGGASNHGTIFVGFSQDQWRQQEMLRRMAGTDGVRDALTNFTTPISGAWYVVPSIEALREILPDEEE
ncbi:MAG: Dyp-type peroxidase [Micrococcaceae bacterium]